MKKRSKANKFFLVLLIAESLFLIIWGIRSYYRIALAQRELERTQAEFTRLELENKELKEQINNLANPFYLEKIAREKLGLAKKEEIVYRILPDTR